MIWIFWQFFKFRTFCAQLGEKILRITGLIFLLQFLNVPVNGCQLEHLGSEKNLDGTSILFKGIIWEEDKTLSCCYVLTNFG